MTGKTGFARVSTRPTVAKVVNAMGSRISADKLRRIFANDHKAIKHIGEIHRFAVALERWRAEKRNVSLGQAKDAALTDLQEKLGEEHFRKVQERIFKLLEGEAEDVAV